MPHSAKDWKEAGYQAALAGEPCEAPTSTELARGAWEQGWRAGNNEKAKLQKRLLQWFEKQTYRNQRYSPPVVTGGKTFIALEGEFCIDNLVDEIFKAVKK